MWWVLLIVGLTTGDIAHSEFGFRTEVQCEARLKEWQRAMGAAGDKYRFACVRVESPRRGA